MSEQFSFEITESPGVDRLRERTGESWPAISSARERSRTLLAQLNTRIGFIVPPDTTCVVYGSLARMEMTELSDVDWTLLVDGCADADHRTVAQRIRDGLREMEQREPAPGGAFGSLTFSHDLIHRIGGDDDTNRNTTQRLLLLLESTPVGHADAYERVVKQVLARYIEEDLFGPGETPYRVPRFLQNDVSRYWRTMAVDFAQKRRERGASKWAMRTAKLRVSRKLMYASGLLNCFSCEFEFLDEARRRRGPWSDRNHVLEHLSALVRVTPLDNLARVVLFYFGELSGAGCKLFGAYDEFLALLDDEEKREHLEALKPADADSDPVYGEVREIGTRFQEALTEIFFERDTPVRDLNRRYGVF